MRYKKGHKLRPFSIKNTGQVLFTDGTNNDLNVNKHTCEAYGYRYINGMCCAYTPSPELIANIESDTLLNNGSNNTISNSGGALINGSNHITESAFGCFITGQKHVIGEEDLITGAADSDDELYINNAAVLGGSYGHATRSGQIVFGGGMGDGAGVSYGVNQMSIYCLGITHDGSGDFTMVIQGDTDRAEEIMLPDNSINIFEIRLTGVCTGGSSGTAGHYHTLVQTGTMLVPESGGNVYNEGTTSETASNGTTATPSIVTTTRGLLRVNVAGVANVNCTWFAVVKIYTNKTRTTF